MSNSLSGKTVFNKNLSCDSVIAGAFFSQSYLEVPEEKMAKHTGQYMMVPTWKLPHLVLIHSQICFCFFKALLDGPTQTAQPDEQIQSGTDWGIGNIIGIYWFLAQSSSNKQPKRLFGKSLEREYNTPFGKFILNGPLGPFGDFSTIPKKVVNTLG